MKKKGKKYKWADGNGYYYICSQCGIRVSDNQWTKHTQKNCSREEVEKQNRFLRDTLKGINRTDI